MCCHVSTKTAYAEEEQVAAEGLEAKKDATKGIDDGNVSPTQAEVKTVDTTSGSPCYSPSPSGSEDVATMLGKSLKEPVKDVAEESLPKDGTTTAQPVQKKAGSASQPPSPDMSQNVNNIVEKHGYAVVKPLDESSKKDMANAVPYEWYELQEKDKDLGFRDMVNRHASSLPLT